MNKEKKCLIVIDSNSIIHRAFHALPPLATKKGELVNAVYGFLLVFFKAIREFKPDFAAAAFDLPLPTFRHKKFKEYKIKRPPTPEGLLLQIPKIKEVLKGFNVPVFEKEGFEADDIIGTIAKLAQKPGTSPSVETIILSGDLDVLQLVDSQTKVYALRKGVKDIVLYDEQLVKEKYQGIGPEHIIEFKALRGDPSDNIPGVKGVGEKTAIELIKKFGNIENLYLQLERKTEEIKGISARLKEVLLREKEKAFLSRELSEIQKNVSIDFNPQICRWGEYSQEKIVQIFKDFEFYSLVARLSELTFNKDSRER